jgi:hypothetical protein
MSKATDNQVDGNHYSKLKIQPLQLAYSINASPCFTKLAKYITRDKGNKAEQMEKGLHVIDLEREIGNRDTLYCWVMTRGGLRLVDAEEEIQEFSMQFENSDIIKDCLMSMFDWRYSEATNHLYRLNKEVLSADK